MNDAANIATLPLVSGARFIDIALTSYGRAFEHPCKTRIVHCLVRRMAGGRITVRHVGGSLVAIDPHDFIGWEIFKTGMYEPESLALKMQIMTGEPGIFVDVGANFGWYTCAVASIAGATVIAIEPDSENCSSLRKNVMRNGFDNVAIFNGAVGPHSALLPLCRRSAGNSGTVAVHTEQSTRTDQPVWVASRSLDVLLTELVHPVAQPVLMKMDVEGYEPQVLAGLDFAGPFRPRNFLIECDATLCTGSWGSRENFATFFTERGYDLFDVSGRPFAPDQPLPEENVWARDRKQGP